MKLSKNHNAKYSTADVSFSVKSADVSEDGTFTGVASPFWGEPDSYGDVIVAGAYKDTIMEGGRNGNGIALLYQHDHHKPIGIWEDLVEKEDGLHVRGRLDLNVQLAREAHSLLKMGALKGLSIGFDLPRLPNGEVDPESYDVVYDKKRDMRVTYYKKLILWEISLVTFPAAVSATVTTVKDFHNCQTERDWENTLRDSGLSKSQAQYLVKLIKPSLRESEANVDGAAVSPKKEDDSMLAILDGLKSLNNKEVRTKETGVVGSRSLPTNDKSTWDGSAARKRMLSRAGGKDNFDPKKFAQGFVVIDGKRENISDYKLPFADVVDGKLVAVWGGVRTAMGVVLGSMGGVDVDQEALKSAYNFLASYYKKFDREVPEFHLEDTKTTDDAMSQILTALRTKQF